MSEPDKENMKLKAFLCHDHFERLCEGDVCATCPSRVENKDAVIALSKVYDDNPEQFNAAVISELKSIRRVQQNSNTRLEKIEESVNGNGKPGLVARMLIIETSLNQSGKSVERLLVIIGLIVTFLLGIGAIVVSVAIK